MEIVKFVVDTRTSKNGNEYTALYGYDKDGNEYFITFINKR